MTWRPSNLSPFCISASAGGAPPGLKRRSKVIVEYSLLAGAPRVPAAAPTTLQSWVGAGARLDSYLQPWALPSPVIVTVIFSHHGSTDSADAFASAGAEVLGTAGAEAPGTAGAATSNSGTIERSTLPSPLVPAPAAEIGAATRPNARTALWSQTQFRGAPHVGEWSRK